MPLTIAVLDASVLVPVSLTDTLLRSAEHRRFVPLWSEAILDEVVRHVTRLHPVGGTETARRRAAFMRGAFPDAMVHGWEDLVDKMANDPKDRHVLAAAATGGADVIVTNNLGDFSNEACAPLGIRALTADAFLCDIWRDDPELARTHDRGTGRRPARPRHQLGARRPDHARTEVRGSRPLKQPPPVAGTPPARTASAPRDRRHRPARHCRYPQERARLTVCTIRT